MQNIWPFVICIIVPRRHRLPAKHCILYDPAYLRGNIHWGAKLMEESASFRAEVTGAKVNDFHDGVFIGARQHDVLRFQVAMGQAFAVHEGDELHQAVHELSCLMFCVAPLQAVERRDRSQAECISTASCLFGIQAG